MAIKSFSIRIDTEMLGKLQIIANYEGRSTNRQIIVLIRQCIESYAHILSSTRDSTSSTTASGGGPPSPTYIIIASATRKKQLIRKSSIIKALKPKTLEESL